MGLSDERAVEEGFETLRANLASAAPSARFEGALVAQMVSGGLELALGVQRDPEVGLVIMFGAGGVLLELTKDVAFGPVPLAEEQARAMIGRTAAGKLLKGYRGSDPLDVDAVARALVALSNLASDLSDEIESIDVNPLIALRNGVYALDGLVVLTAK